MHSLSRPVRLFQVPTITTPSQRWTLSPHIPLATWRAKSKTRKGLVLLIFFILSLCLSLLPASPLINNASFLFLIFHPTSSLTNRQVSSLPSLFYCSCCRSPYSLLFLSFAVILPVHAAHNVASLACPQPQQAMRPSLRIKLTTLYHDMVALELRVSYILYITPFDSDVHSICFFLLTHSFRITLLSLTIDDRQCITQTWLAGWRQI